MTRKALLIPFVCWQVFVFAQPSCDFKMQEYSCEKVQWISRSLETMKLQWENRTIRLEYEELHDSILLRKEYHASGHIKSTAEVYQIKTSDTIYMKNHRTGAEEMKVTSGFSDVLHGEYREYGDKRKGHRTTGQFKEGKQVGEWTKKEEQGTLFVANYRNGKLSGPYAEYYHSAYEPRTKLKWQGQYKVVAYQKMTEQVAADSATVELKPKAVEEAVKTGLWRHFDQGGNILEIVNYTWVRQ